MTNQNFTDITADLIEYLTNIIKNLTRAIYMEVALSNSILIVIADNTVLYSMDLSGKIDPNINYGYRNNYDNYSSHVVDYNLIPKLFYKYHEFQTDQLYNNKIYEDENLREDPTYEKYLGNKATDGASFYFMNASNCTPFIPVFSGLPIISKQDRIGVNLFDLSNNIILVNYKIFKKKLNLHYNLYFKILDINRPIRS